MDQQMAPQRPRKLVLCFDGTGNKFHGDDSDSNILKIFRMLDRTAGNQYHYYQPGIGTYVHTNDLSHTSVSERFRSWYAKAKDSAVGSSFDKHVVGGYRFLMRFYNPDDEIYIFGFSRGAYTARFLAEMLDHVGLLSHGNEEMIFFAWKTFSQWQSRPAADPDDADAKARRRELFRFMKGFRETFSRPVRRIRFLGLFDTVNSVPRFETAWMQRTRFPYTARSSARVIRHAVSIDERRAKFRQDLMYQQKPRARRRVGAGKMRKSKIGKEVMAADEEGDGHHSHLHQSLDTGGKQPQATGRGRRSRQGAAKLGIPRDNDEDEGEHDRYRCRSRTPSRSRAGARAVSPGGASSIYSQGQPPPDQSDTGLDPEEDKEQSIDEVWFAGCHADIGGGWETDEGQKPLSHIPLMWMVREATKAGLNFDAGKVIAAGCGEAIQGHFRHEVQDGYEASTVPDIHIITSSPSLPNVPGSPSQEALSKSQAETNRKETEESQQTEDSVQASLVAKAHLSRIHDCLDFKGGLPSASVLSWRFMEYLPFRRMDLREDGTWKPIRWPLPLGEVRDVPVDVRVHGSVLRRMREDEAYRPGNLIVGGGGRGVRVAPKDAGIGDWVCVSNKEDGNIGEIWIRNRL